MGRPMWLSWTVYPWSGSPPVLGNFVSSRNPKLDVFDVLLFVFMAPLFTVASRCSKLMGKLVRISLQLID
jgi:hypothetical protein